jgi:hypothetical protein
MKSDFIHRFLFTKWSKTDFHNTVQVATHRHGCCVLQRCIDAADEDKRAELIMKVSEHALQLIQDPFGKGLLCMKGPKPKNIFVSFASIS